MGFVLFAAYPSQTWRGRIIVETASRADGGRAAFSYDRGLGPLVGDDRRGIGEDLAAGAVVGVVVAEDEVPDQSIEPLVDLRFDPGGRLRVDGVGGDHALRRRQEDGEVEVVLEAEEVARDVGDGALGLGLTGAGATRAAAMHAVQARS